MQRTITRVLLILFGLAEAVQGIWATAIPMGFYLVFPGFRSGWVAMDGPFNEHLIRDFGSLSLALTAVLIGAAVIGTTAVARMASIAALLFSVPHIGYHLGHLAHFPVADQVLIVVTLALTVVVPLATLVLPGRREEVSSPATP
ncbi:hypothetical protein [Amycolatopsis jiangsuensis]|uniref:DUF4345 domain-containing protein n=1 Tax=Amycolatopsis jiangsuensis TaxID=1181879 RepID=A0A840IVK6_9PSEU|nr:hypothetical protein [Amycolatopsis jiangsuensis]MBB4685549.1 hypothetical protein [Amycolatopsis jiangsuensis]